MVLDDPPLGDRPVLDPLHEQAQELDRPARRLETEVQVRRPLVGPGDPDPGGDRVALGDQLLDRVGEVGERVESPGGRLAEVVQSAELDVPMDDVLGVDLPERVDVLFVPGLDGPLDHRLVSLVGCSWHRTRSHSRRVR